MLPSIKTIPLWIYFPLLTFAACNPLPEDSPTPRPSNWGPETYQVDAFVQNGSVFYYARIDSAGHLQYSVEPVHESQLPFHFYQSAFQRHPEFLLSSTFPLRCNWFRISAPDCQDPGSTPTGIEFASASAREKGYFLNARLDTPYWNCLRDTTGLLEFSFQLRTNEPVPATPFTLEGFYDLDRQVVHLKAKRDEAGTWHSTNRYQIYQEPGPKDFSIQVAKPAPLGAEQTLLRMGSPMPCLPQSVWIGLPGECLDEADWEVHSNRHYDRFLLDVVIPDCYLDCLHHVADGFEFAVDFFQYLP